MKKLLLAGVLMLSIIHVAHAETKWPSPNFVVDCRRDRLSIYFDKEDYEGEHAEGIADIAHDGQAAQIGHDLAQEFEPLGSSIGRLARQSGDVAAWSRQTGDDAGADRIACGREHDRDHRCCLLRRENCWRTLRDNDIDLEPGKLSCNLGGALLASLRPAILDCNGATFDPPESHAAAAQKQRAIR
jgi:hypothetical protein